MFASISIANKAVLFATGAATGAAFFAITDAVAISIVTSTSAVVMAGISAYFAYKAKSIAEATGKAVDGHLTEFKSMAKTAFTAEGVLLEKADEKLRRADAQIARAEIISEGMGKSGDAVAMAVVPVIEATVKQAVVESVKAPVKEAVREVALTDEQVDQLLKVLGRKK